MRIGAACRPRPRRRGREPVGHAAQRKARNGRQATARNRIYAKSRPFMTSLRSEHMQRHVITRLHTSENLDLRQQFYGLRGGGSAVVRAAGRALPVETAPCLLCAGRGLDRNAACASRRVAERARFRPLPRRLGLNTAGGRGAAASVSQPAFFFCGPRRKSIPWSRRSALSFGLAPQGRVCDATSSLRDPRRTDRWPSIDAEVAAAARALACVSANTAGGMLTQAILPDLPTDVSAVFFGRASAFAWTLRWRLYGADVGALGLES